MKIWSTMLRRVISIFATEENGYHDLKTGRISMQNICEKSDDPIIELNRLLLEINPELCWLKKRDLDLHDPVPETKLPIIQFFHENFLEHQQQSFSENMRLWDEYLLEGFFIERLIKNPLLARKVRVVNQAYLSIMASTMTVMTTKAYSKFLLKAPQYLEGCNSIKAITESLSMLASMQSEYVRNELLKRLDIASCRILFERYVMLAVYLTEMGNFFSAQAVYQSFFYVDVQKLFDLKNCDELSSQIRVQLQYLESLYGTSERCKQKLLETINQKTDCKLPGIHRITGKFELEFAGKDENLRFSKMNVQEKIKAIKKNDEQLFTNDFLKDKNLIEMEDQFKKIDEMTIHLSLCKKEFFLKELKQIVLFECETLPYAQCFANEIQSEHVICYLKQRECIQQLKEVRVKCESKYGVLAQDENAEEYRSLLHSSSCQIKNICNHSPQ